MKRSKALLAAAAARAAATGCAVTYTVSSQWQGGFGANVAINNLGDPVNGWRLTWPFGAGQAISQLWNASFTQSGGAGTTVLSGRTGATISIPAQAGESNLVERTASPTTTALPFAAVSGSPASAPRSLGSRTIGVR